MTTVDTKVAPNVDASKVEVPEPRVGTFPGFGKLEFPEIPNQDIQKIKDYLKSLPPEEQARIINAANEEMQRQANLRLGQLDIFNATLSDTLSRIEAPRSTMHTLVRYGAKLREFLGADKGDWAHHEDQVKAEIEEFAKKDLPAVRDRLLKGEEFSEIIKDYPILQKAAEKYKLETKRPTNEAELKEQQVGLLEYYRNAKGFDAAEQLSHELLKDKLDAEAAKISDKDKKELLAKAERTIEPQVKAQEKGLKNPTAEQLQQGAKAMTDEDIKGFKEKLTQTEYQRLLNQQAAKTIDESKLTGVEAKAWNIYKDTFDPKSEWFNLTDAHHDMVVREVVINAPLIMASGGTASVARMAFTSGAKAVVGRMIAGEAIRAGAELGGKELLEQGGKWLGETALRRAGTGAAGLLVEGATFEAAHLGLQGEWLGNMPDWGQRILWSCATFEMINVGGKLGESAFRSAAKEGANVVVKETALGKALGQITNEPVRKAAEYLLVKGHTEAAGMLLAGAAQQGCVSGNINGIIDNLPEELLHTYVTLGALKVGQGVQNIASAGIDLGVAGLADVTQGTANSWKSKMAKLPERSAIPREGIPALADTNSVARNGNVNVSLGDSTGTVAKEDVNDIKLEFPPVPPQQGAKNAEEGSSNDHLDSFASKDLDSEDPDSVEPSEGDRKMTPKAQQIADYFRDQEFMVFEVPV